MSIFQPVETPESRRYEQWSRDNVNRAILNLAEAAGWAERSREHTPAPLGAEHNLWFVVRALCAEYGVPYERMVERGRERARRED